VNSGACYGDWIPCPAGDELASVNPATGETLAAVRMAGVADYECVVEHARAAFLEWRMVPAPKRGEIVREIGDELRARKAELGALVTLEMGKILAEGRGEVQEMIDVADFAVGLSRQLYGLTMTSERPGHRMYEQWHPLGVVGVISAFNFPVAVWSWNALIAAVCGDCVLCCVLWRPSSETPLTAIAVQKICNRVTDRHRLKGIFNLVIGPSRTVGEALIGDVRIPLVSFTGSTEVGRHVSETVARRLGRSILELGGNNGVVVMNDANFDLALRAILFGAVGTAGQRCTTTRRAFLQRGIAPAHEGGAGRRLSAGARGRSDGRGHPDGTAGEPPRRGRHDGRHPPHPRAGRRDPERRREAYGLFRRTDAGARAPRYADP
jgi:aldehyde dehydrogenase (NAD+)